MTHNDDLDSGPESTTTSGDTDENASSAPRDRTNPQSNDRTPRDHPTEDHTGSRGNSPTAPPDESEDQQEGPPAVPPQEVDRVFELMEEAIIEDALEGPQLDRLLSVLDRSITSSSETNPETLSELLTILEDAVIQPDDLDELDVNGVLSVLDEALTETTAVNDESLNETFDVFESAIRDPTNIQPEDVERFRTGIETAIADVTEPASQSIESLLPFPGLAETDSADTDLPEDVPDMVRIARVAAGITQRATDYSIESGLRTGTRMAYAVTNAESPAELLTETRVIALDELQRAGIDIGEEQADWLAAHDEDVVSDRPMTMEALAKRGERLLAESAEIGRDESLHPAFASIIDELAPDEARILRLFATDGIQPTIDIRDRELVPFKSRLVADHLSMIGSDAGCRYDDRTPMYLQNLERLGLIAFSDDPVDDLKRYQVLEAQPHVGAAKDAAKRPKTVYGSVHLTDFGVEFFKTCFPTSVAVDRPTSRYRD